MNIQHDYKKLTIAALALFTIDGEWRFQVLNRAFLGAGLGCLLALLALWPALRILTVKVIDLFALVTHLPHTVDGFVITVVGKEHTVIDECAG